MIPRFLGARCRGTASAANRDAPLSLLARDDLSSRITHERGAVASGYLLVLSTSTSVVTVSISNTEVVPFLSTSGCQSEPEAGANEPCHVHVPHSQPTQNSYLQFSFTNTTHCKPAVLIFACTFTILSDPFRNQRRSIHSTQPCQHSKLFTFRRTSHSMVNSLLFRWEDSQALQHHCGFCERPLSHPGARASCFGVHSEPCHRFHQVCF